MKKRLTVAVLGSVAATALLSVFRILTLPQVQQTVGGTYSPLWVLATVVLLAGVVLCGMRRYDEMVAIRPAFARAIGAGAIAAGLLLIVTSLAELKPWLESQTLPYPINETTTAADTVMFYLLVGFGVLGGLSLLWLGIGTMIDRPAPHGVMQWLILLPLLWNWTRILRYELSHISTLQIAKHWSDVLLLVVEMLFLLTLVKLDALPEQKPGRFAAGIALCAGVSGLVGSILRGYLALTTGDQTTAIAGLVTAADIGIAALAFTVAFALLTSEKQEEPEVQPATADLPETTEDTSPNEEEEEEEEGNSDEPTLLHTDDVFLTTIQDDESLDNEDGDHSPLALEDVIDDILKQLSDGKN